MAIQVRNYLHKTLPTHNEKLRLRKKDLKLHYGFAAHTGGITVERVNFNDKGGRLIHKDFILGILPNSVARLESLNKQYTEYNFLVSGNYKKCFNAHCKDINDEKLIKLFNSKEKYVSKSLGRIDINDGKRNGHLIYAIEDSFFEQFQ